MRSLSGECKHKGYGGKSYQGLKCMQLKSSRGRSLEATTPDLREGSELTVGTITPGPNLRSPQSSFSAPGFEERDCGQGPREEI